MGELLRRLWFLINRSRFERELREEMDAHRAMKGTNEAPFGNSLRLRDEAVDAWGWRPLERLWQDLRFGARLLWRAPAFTLTSVIVLALGVGVNLAAFQVFDRLAFSPRPVRDPETLVRIHRRSPQSTSTTLSYPAFDFYRHNAQALRSAMGLIGTRVTIGEGDDRRFRASFVTGNYFDEMGARPLQGRLLQPQDESAGAPPVAVVSETLWRTVLASAPTVVGRDLRINGQVVSVVGVTPETFVGLNETPPSVWMPVTQHAVAFPGSTLLTDWTGGTVEFYARIPAGRSLQAVESAERTTVDALRAQRPRDVWTDEWLGLLDASRVLSIQDGLPAFALIASLVGLVLMAACMNLGLLVLARTLGRDREFAVRLSVGATRRRLARQLLTEHVVLGLLGAAAGCLIALPAANAVFRLTDSSPGLTSAFSWRTLTVAVVLALICSTVFGFAPVWQTLRPTSARRTRMRNVLLAVQVTAASALVIVSALLVRGVTNIVNIPLGFDYRHTIVADPDLFSFGMTPEAAADFFRRVEPRVRQIPSVRNVAVSSLPPLGNKVTINNEKTVFYDVTPEFFDTMQIGLVKGRIFRADERGVVVLNESLARRKWPGEDPLGKVFSEAIVIGVVHDARSIRLSDASATECYRPLQPKDMAMAVLVVSSRTADGTGALAPAVAAMLKSENPRLVPAVTTLQDALDEELSKPRQAAVVISMLGLCALLLAVTGLTGMVAFTVSQRLREIGVRIALGARPVHVVRSLFAQFGRSVLIGSVAGSLLAITAGLILSRELYGISSLDPLAHVGAFALFAGIATLAALPSFRRALRVDPVTILRHE